MCLLQYGMIYFLSGDNQKEVINTTLSFINFLGSQGLCISKNKLQFSEAEVKCLGHLISKGQQRIGPERIEGVTGLPLPGTKQELRKFLGLVGYCSLWIDSSALKTKSLYLKLTQEGPDSILWTPEEIEQVDYLKQTLITALVLALSSLEQPFYLFVIVNKGVALGVLTQKHGGQHQPVDFLSDSWILSPEVGLNAFRQ
jgi:hypothetical protein